jgi:hypothetical protein
VTRRRSHVPDLGELVLSRCARMPVPFRAFGCNSRFDEEEEGNGPLPWSLGALNRPHFAVGTVSRKGGSFVLKTIGWLVISWAILVLCVAWTTARSNHQLCEVHAGLESLGIKLYVYVGGDCGKPPPR